MNKDKRIEELKNTVRSITEPCEECEGRCEFEKTPYHEAFICDGCKGKGWCPKLEEGCKVRLSGLSSVYTFAGDTPYDLLFYGYNEREGGHIQERGARKIKENYGKPLETREILLAIQSSGKYTDIINISIGELSIEVNSGKQFIHISLDIPPAEYSDELKKEIIKLLKK